MMPVMAGTQRLRYLSRADVESTGLGARDVLGLLESAFAEKRAGLVELPPKIGVHTRPDAFLHAMPAYLGGRDVAGIKWVSGYPGNAGRGVPYLHGLVILSDAETGRPLSVMDATWITEVRTAAASVLGIRRLLEAPPAVVAIVGCGRQGNAHARLLGEVFDAIGEIRCFDPVTERAETLAVTLGTARGRVAESPADAAGGADVVVTCAPIVRVPEPTIHLPDLAPACVVCAIDFDSSVGADVARAALFVVDDLPQYRHYVELGYFGGYPEAALELADVLAGELAARNGAPALFAPLGVALEDVAVAAEVYRRAAERSLGTELQL